MSRESFYKKVLTWKVQPLDFQEFDSKIKGEPEYVSIVNKIEKITTDWAKDMGLLAPEKKKEKEKALTDQELLYKEFFENHEFASMELQKLFADFGTLLTGVNMGRFMTLSTSNKKLFSGGANGLIFYTFVVVIPTEFNPNSHNYTPHVPIIANRVGDTFIRSSGTLGNSMCRDKRGFRLPKKEDIEFILTNVLLKTGNFAEEIVYSVLD